MTHCSPVTGPQSTLSTPDWHKLFSLVLSSDEARNIECSIPVRLGSTFLLLACMSVSDGHLRVMEPGMSVQSNVKQASLGRQLVEQAVDDALRSLFTLTDSYAALSEMIHFFIENLKQLENKGSS